MERRECEVGMGYHLYNPKNRQASWAAPEPRESTRRDCVLQSSDGCGLLLWDFWHSEWWQKILLIVLCHPSYGTWWLCWDRVTADSIIILTTIVTLEENVALLVCFTWAWEWRERDNLAIWEQLLPLQMSESLKGKPFPPFSSLLSFNSLLKRTSISFPDPRLSWKDPKNFRRPSQPFNSAGKWSGLFKSPVNTEVTSLPS